jgi:hypothetical protein
MSLDASGLFADRRVVSTIAVAHFARIGLDACRGWAWALRVPRLRGAFAWTRDDVERLVMFLATSFVDPVPSAHSS